MSRIVEHFKVEVLIIVITMYILLPVDNPLGMDVSEGIDKLQDMTLDFNFSQSLSPIE